MTNSIKRVAELLAKAADDEKRVFPATELYNEGWMLRLVLDWFSRNRHVDHDLRFGENSRWYSEALLPSAFLARYRGDKLAESWTHADGVIGHFSIGEKGTADLSLTENATEFVVTEAKMFSKLSDSTTNASYFNQAAWSVACMAEVAKKAGIAPTSFANVAFYVIAPEAKIEEGVFAEYMDVESMRNVVFQRVKEYDDPEKNDWFEEWFLPMSEAANIRSISWEEILTIITDQDETEGASLIDFYAKCLKFNFK